jgi:hypothetical protein
LSATVQVVAYALFIDDGDEVLVDEKDVMNVDRAVVTRTSVSRSRSAGTRVPMVRPDTSSRSNVRSGTSGVILVPAGTWHNVVNVGNGPLKVSALYAPPEHARGAVHATTSDADSAEHH